MSGFLRDFTAKRSEGLIGPSTDPPANGVEELQRMFEAIPPPTPRPSTGGCVSAFETLAVACVCGKETAMYPQADVRSGRCRWTCGRPRCGPAT